MCPIDATNVRRTPEIAVDRLRLLLADLPPHWRLFTDDGVQLIFVDGDDEPCGYVDLVDQRLVLLDDLYDGYTKSRSSLTI